MSPEKKVRLAIAKFEGFSTTECAELLEVSTSTIQRVLQTEKYLDGTWGFKDDTYHHIHVRIEKLMTEEIVRKHMSSREKD